ncbi:MULTISPECIES: DUF2752 domain-containing protein [Mycobacteriales]|uniref:DUF2752 domain-containing protein n=1 Tax=Mycobacteriales TaxID=85007 RepID=UPI0009D4AEAB|nr:DUF2752 domain-containing protein [Gordonia sp. YY1]ART90652.1 hypothetical protein [Rhodococcus rhodochrous]KAF0969021.1 hypothetical protein BPODLACK_02251 [Gordonia sp. YY1]OOL33139.1 Hypothetical protein GQ85_037 [Rhodococcus rhodochrous]
MTVDDRSDLRLSTSGTLGAGVVGLAGTAAVAAACVLTPAGIAAGPGICPFAMTTGLPCPGCGLTRSWVALMHGDVAESFRFNVFGPILLVLTAVTVVFAAVTLVRRRRMPLDGWRDIVLGRAGAVLLGAWLSYGLVRIVDTAAGWGIFPIVV